MKSLKSAVFCTRLSIILNNCLSVGNLKGARRQFISVMEDQHLTLPGVPLRQKEILAEWVIGIAIAQTGRKNVSDADRRSCRSLVIDYLGDSATMHDLEQAIKKTFGRCNACNLLKAVLKIEPLPADSPSLSMSTERESQKRRFWIDSEDLRLIAAVYRYGEEQWPLISKFVGNGRTRHECYHRWARTLNPRLSKDRWTDEEVKQLVELTKSGKFQTWGQVAKKIGTRCDLQCRYKYQQMKRAEREETIPETQEKAETHPEPLTLPPVLLSPSSTIEDMSLEELVEFMEKFPLYPFELVDTLW